VKFAKVLPAFSMRQNLIVVTGLIVSALLCYMFSSTSVIFVYNRQLIMGGEWWRLFTGHLVHLSFSHLALNIAVLIIILFLGNATLQGLPRVIFMSVMAIGPCLFLLDSRLQVYGGLSGVTSACIGYSLKRAYHLGTKRSKLLYGTLLVGCLAKIILEFFSKQPFFSTLPRGVENVPLSHLIGYLIALLPYRSEVLPALPARL